MKKKVSDTRIDAALLKYWRSQDPSIPRSEITMTYGHSVGQVRRLVARFNLILVDIKRALNTNDRELLERALDRLADVRCRGKRVDLADLLEDVADVWEAMESL